MKFVEIFLLIVFCAGESVILAFAFLSGKFTKMILFNAFLGIAVLAVFKALETVSGIFIPINQYTVTACGTMGVPAVVGILILRFIFL